MVIGSVHGLLAQTTARQVQASFQREIKKTVGAQYLLYLPKGYSDDPQKKWPLILFLHGAGERGNDLNFVSRHGPPKLVELGREFEFVIVSP